MAKKQTYDQEPELPPDEVVPTEPQAPEPQASDPKQYGTETELCDKDDKDAPAGAVYKTPTQYLDKEGQPLPAKE